jgi:hypothetical protein
MLQRDIETAFKYYKEFYNCKLPSRGSRENSHKLPLQLARPEQTPVGSPPPFYASSESLT